jgi:leader peptidase (prepilin peptidase)/N-methyltransferase
MIFFYIFSFFLGAILGSFLDCVIFRLERKENFLKGRSYCPNCHHLLSFFDLIPIFSFLILKGKCRYCKKPIPLEHFLMEIASAILFSFLTFLHFKRFPINFFSFLSLIFEFGIWSCFVLIFVFDLKHYLIPDEAIYVGIFFSLFRAFVLKINLFNLFLAILPSLFFLFLILISKEEWMGWGDFKLSILTGVYLGWPKVLIALFCGIFIGSVFGIIFILLKKMTLKSKIPFAPFLISGIFLSLFILL